VEHVGVGVESQEVAGVGEPGIIKKSVEVASAGRGIVPLLPGALGGVAVVVDGGG
jgi:hypothetical protein